MSLIAKINKEFSRINKIRNKLGGLLNQLAKAEFNLKERVKTKGKNNLSINDQDLLLSQTRPL